MKQIVILWIGVVLFANSQELTIEEASKLRSYNHSFSGKAREERAMRRVAKISRDRAYTIAKSVCKQKIYGSRLKMRNNRLFYIVNLKNCSVKVDALDGSIIGGE